jgi:hypothetical protein
VTPEYLSKIENARSDMAKQAREQVYINLNGNSADTMGDDGDDGDAGSGSVGPGYAG